MDIKKMKEEVIKHYGASYKVYFTRNLNDQEVLFLWRKLQKLAEDYRDHIFFMKNRKKDSEDEDFD